MFGAIWCLLFARLITADPTPPSTYQFTHLEERISIPEKTVEDLVTVQRKHQEQITPLDQTLKEGLSNTNAKNRRLRDTISETHDAGDISTTTAADLKLNPDETHFTTTEETQTLTKSSTVSRFLEAVERGDSESISRLSHQSNDPGLLRRYNNQGYQALHLAVIAGNQDLVKYLLAEGASLLSRGRNLQTPLHFAVANGHAAIVDLLLRTSWMGGEHTLVTTLDYFGKTPFDLAMDTGNVDIIRDLARYCNEDIIGSYTARAVAEKNQEILTALLTSSIPIKMPYLQNALNSVWNKDSMWEIINAAESKSLQEVNLSEALHRASRNGRAAALNPLICAGANISSEVDGKTALVEAVEKKHLKCVKELIALGANTSRIQQGVSALQVAARVDCSECMHLIMQSGFVEKNVVDALLKNGTLIDIALNSWSILSARFLLKRGAVIAKNEMEMNYLLGAVTKCDVDVLKILIDSGADINIIIPFHDISLLAVAVHHRNKDCIQLLLSSGADPNLVLGNNRLHNTALHEAVIIGDIDIVKVLLEFGADVNMIGTNRYTPISLAKTEEMKNLLTNFRFASKE